MYTTLKAIGELALSATAREHLGLDYSTLATYKARTSAAQTNGRATQTPTDAPETLLKASTASLGDFAATPLGVGTPYWWVVTESELNNEEKAATYGVEKIHGLVFVDGEEAPLTRRCGLGAEAGQLIALE